MTNKLALLQSEQKKNDTRVIELLAICLFVVIALSLSAGEIWLWPNQWTSEPAQIFIGQIRLPRMLAVITIGAALAVTGAIMQALFENPLAEPGLLGISNGAGVAVVLTVLLSSGITHFWLISTSAIIGALVLTSVLLYFADVFIVIGGVAGLFFILQKYFPAFLRFSAGR